MSIVKLKSDQPKRTSWLKKLLWVAIIGVVLLAIVFFVATSTAFIKGVIVPQAGKALDSDITVGDVKLSTFSQLVLNDVKLTPHGGEQLFSVGLVRARYSLFDIIRGNIVVEEVTVESPSITIVRNADGTSNLDALLKGSTDSDTSKSSSAPPKLDVKLVSIKNGLVRQTQKFASGAQEIVEVTDFNLNIANIKNGAEGKLDIMGMISANNSSATNAGSLSAKLNGNLAFQLTPDALPAMLNGKTTFAIEKATGKMSDLNALSVTLDCETTPTEIKHLAVRFAQSSEALGELRMSGPFDSAKTEGKLTVVIDAIDRRVLNLAGAAAGLDFGKTAISSTNLIEIASGGSVITASGRFDIARLQLIQQKKVSPTLDIHTDYAIRVDTSAKSATLQSFNLTGAQNSKAFLRGDLNSPMAISWGSAAATGNDSVLNVAITSFNIADWKSFAGEASPAGQINGNLRLVSQKGGALLNFDLTSQIRELSASLGADRLPPLEISAEIHGRATELKNFDIESYRVELARNAQPALTLSGSGKLDGATQELELKVVLQSALTQLLALLPQPPMELQSGVLDFVGQLGSKAKGLTFSGELSLANLVAKNGLTTPLAAKLKIDSALTGQTAEIRQCTLTLTPTDRAKNELNLTGKVDMSNPEAISGALKLAADALDFTGYYDLMAEKPASTTAQPTQTTSPAPSSPSEDKEPDPVKLPLQNFTFEANMGHIYLREVDVANFRLLTKIDGGHVVLQPCELSLNGAPVSAQVDLDLGVPGYKYNVAFNAQAIPLTPIVNTFQPARKGQIGGQLLADAKIQGAGITGEGLQKNLKGNFSLLTTNMNLSINNVRSPTINTIINVIVGLPDLIKNPAAIIGMGKKSQSGWADELMSKTIDVIAARGVAGDGRFVISQADILSAAFRVQTTGEVAIATILTNSTIQFPVNVALGRYFADKIGLVNSDVPTNAAYVPLPDFLKLKGTVGKPEPEISKRGLAILAAKTGGGIAKQVGLAAGDHGKSLYGAANKLLLGTTTTNSITDASGTNSAAEPPKKSGGILNFFKKSKK